MPDDDGLTGLLVTEPQTWTEYVRLQEYKKRCFHPCPWPWPLYPVLAAIVAWDEFCGWWKNRSGPLRP